MAKIHNPLYVSPRVSLLFVEKSLDQVTPPTGGAEEKARKRDRTRQYIITNGVNVSSRSTAERTPLGVLEITELGLG